jgi:NAD(P)-dependent dehydrogenase (short-subunit alcohol dehydrogenase family)
MSNPFSYAGKRVVVTGAATGVGAALLDLLAEIGAPEVTVLDLKAPSGPHTRFLETDLSDRAAVDAAIEAIGSLGGPVDVLFNNAGVAATQPPRVVLSVNYLALRRLSEGLLERIPSGGAIVNTASIAGGRWPEHVEQINQLIDLGEAGDWDASLDWVDANLDAVGGDSYSFSKEVVRVWGMRHSRRTMARGVRTNSVCPAPIDTPLLDDFKATMGEKLIDWTAQQSTGAYMTPREVAAPLAFLGSEAASYVNGHDLVADGGFNAAMTTGQVDFSTLG